MKKSTWVSLVEGTSMASKLPSKRLPQASKSLTRDMLQTFFADVVALIEQGERVVIPAFGVFAPSTRRARKGRHPITGEPIELPAVRTIRFRPHRKLRK